MKSTMVLWLYSAEQYRTSTPINEIAEHAARHGFNDEPTEVLCLHGHEFIPAADLAALRERNFIVHDAGPVFRGVAARYPNLRQAYPNHFFECFLRWIVVKEVFQGEPVVAWDADIFYNDRLSAIHAAFAGSTFTVSSTCLAALHDPSWLEAYARALDDFERDPAAGRAAIFAELAERHRGAPGEFADSFFGGLQAAALADRAEWEKLFQSTPEELFTDWLVRTSRLPHHVARPIDHVLCPQPLLLPLLAWTHPMGPGLPARVTAAGDAGAPDFTRVDGRYHYRGRPLAFVHYQGAVFRACAAHHMLTHFLDEPAPVFDEFYCPPERRRGRALSWFFHRDGGARQRLARLQNLPELLAQWGDPYSERAMARRYLIDGDLSEVMARAGLEAATAPAERDTILVLTHDPKHPLYTSWLRDSPHPVIYEVATGVDYAFPAQVGLVVAADCYREPRATLLCRAMEEGIPTLLLADGILEYRNTFEHPDLAAGAIFQPALAHKVACLGRSQARILESWGNAAQVEVAGSARFDRYATLRRRRREEGEPFKVLVTTAITPYFTPEQHERVRRSLADLRAWFSSHPAAACVPVQVEWRVTKGLDAEIGVDSVVSDLSGRQLAEVLQHVDAVISTPSTTMIEAMLLGLPVAVLDYCNCPHYLQPAWRITAAEHIGDVVAELVNPPEPKRQFQETTLHDALECRTPAAPRLRQLAGAMLAAGRTARAAGQPLALPPRLLGIGGDAPVEAVAPLDLARLYPDAASFAERDIARLQVEVGQLRAHAAQLERGGRAAAADPEAVRRQVQLAVQWRSKVEAAAALQAAGQNKVAVDLLMQALKVVQVSQQAEAILEALLEVCARLRPLDPARTAVLLETAAQLGRRMQRADALAQVEQLRASLPQAQRLKSRAA